MSAGERGSHQCGHDGKHPDAHVSNRYGDHRGCRVEHSGEQLDEHYRQPPSHQRSAEPADSHDCGLRETRLRRRRGRPPSTEIIARVRRRSASPAASTRPPAPAASRTAKVSSSRVRPVRLNEVRPERTWVRAWVISVTVTSAPTLSWRTASTVGWLWLLVLMRNAPTASDPVCRAT